MLVVLASEVYTRNLLCIMEIFWFLAMGGSVCDIVVLDAYGDRDPSSPRAGGQLDVRHLFRSMDSSEDSGETSPEPLSFRLDEAVGRTEAETDR